MPDPFKIETLTAYIAENPGEEGEGIIGMTLPDGTWMPFVCADHDRARQLRPLAVQIGKVSGRRVTIAQFAVRTDLEVIEP